MNPVSLGLPHRPPFLFVDDVLELVPGEFARGVKTFPADDPLFEGHFPGNPLVPGVLITEALAQMAGLAAAAPGRRFLLSAIRGMKFPSSAKPGDLIELSAKTHQALGGLWMMETHASVSGEIVAEGRIVLNEITT